MHLHQALCAIAIAAALDAVAGPSKAQVPGAAAPVAPPPPVAQPPQPYGPPPPPIAQTPQPYGPAPQPVAQPYPQPQPPPPPPSAGADQRVPGQPYGPPPGAYVLPGDAPEELPYDDERPIPWGYRLESRYRKGLLIGGIVTLGIGYVVTLPFGMDSDGPEANRWLLVPAAGPWLTMALHDHHQCDNNESGCALAGLGDFFEDVVLVGVGVVQATGAALLIAGLAAQTKVLVRNTPDAQATRWLPMPTTFGGRGIGLSVTGITF